MASYIAVIHKDTDSDFGVSFPDFPGCITAGATIDAAAKKRGMSRSSFLAHATQNTIHSNQYASPV